MDKNFEELKSILNRIEQALKSEYLNHKEVFHIDDLCQYTGFSKSQIYTLTSKGIIPHRRPSGKILFFKKQEIIDWLTSNHKNL